MSTIDELLELNDVYTASYAGAGMSPEPTRKTAVVACMDARMDVHGMLGLQPGEAHVIRNAGGIVTEDVIRSLMISQRALGTRTVLLVQHTNCGLAGKTDEELRDVVEKQIGVRPSFPLGTFPEVKDSVRRGLEALRSSPLVYDQDMRGF